MSDQQPNVVETQLLRAAEAIEAAVDDELDRVNNMDDDEIMLLRAKRKRQLQDMAKRRDGWIAKGHGSYHEVTDVKHFFECIKSSERVLVHFRRGATSRCSIVDGHLQKIARAHFETRFCSVDCEKHPGLPQQFNVVMLPTLMLVEGGNTFHSIIGFEDFGNTDDFSTDDMCKVLSQFGMINDKGMFAADQNDD
jgi:hypothetical protein